MFSLRRETDYALRLLKTLSTAPKGRASLMTVSNQTGISFLFLQKIARKLRIAGLIKSTKGVSGGYELKIKPNKLSLKNIISVVEGGCALWSCCEGGGGCAQEKCGIRKRAKTVNKKVLKFLTDVKLSDF
ncbi:MAG: hypothetical protein A3J93_00215 [Candidatus Magasanikbacteria bacterium RIFOXYC2_FULL_42_28]|uniref:Rrf2 family transcriptional regulator n=1 Tax=Candidatus Magasanikbacteria bacterium RIFOXYC2_FULL_42_28 TaxID=1798704 RepID=A0A1F6NWQ9_9BACT|nr:MAG: hypothetical protein A3J93_00215 [Candidatus Magasanikbacteria bacterium RIFOXYC2_FULL_42_28]